MAMDGTVGITRSAQDLNATSGYTTAIAEKKCWWFHNQRLSMPTIWGRKYLIADFSIDCNSEEYLAFLPVVYGCLVLYCFGIPFVAFMVLRGYIDGIHYDPHEPISEENPKTRKPNKYKDNLESKTKLLDLKATSHGAFGFLWQGMKRLFAILGGSGHYDAKAIHDCSDYDASGRQQEYPNGHSSNGFIYIHNRPCIR